MGYQVLARKWRPGKFSELVGQEHVVKAISSALDNNRLHHAYLFTGTRGVGKTTIARIFSRSLNCETGISSNPCGQCASCVDIEQGSYVDLLEIDAASRTKVEDTREILDNVQYRPTRGEYKVYLIDEVHMLSKHSFNALLKTLEEPPPHVKFLLATTDPQKLPVTILSRCLQFNLKALTREQISGQLEHILRQEQIPFEKSALFQLAKSAQGSMRDALSLTDQAIAQGDGQVIPDVVADMLGLIDSDKISRVIDALLAQDKITLLNVSDELALLGADYKAALGDMMSLFHQIALTQFVPEACKLETNQARKIFDWAKTLPPEQVQLLYQIALQGRKELEWAQDAKSGFEMTLIRMLAFSPKLEKVTSSDFKQLVASQEVTVNQSSGQPAAIAEKKSTESEINSPEVPHVSDAISVSQEHDVSQQSDIDKSHSFINQLSEVKADTKAPLTSTQQTEYGEKSADSVSQPASDTERNNLANTLEAKALTPEAEAINPEAEAINPEAEAINPKAVAINPKAEAINPQAEGSSERHENKTIQEKLNSEINNIYAQAEALTGPGKEQHFQQEVPPSETNEHTVETGPIPPQSYQVEPDYSELDEQHHHDAEAQHSTNNNVPALSDQELRHTEAPSDSNNIVSSTSDLLALHSQLTSPLEPTKDVDNSTAENIGITVAANSKAENIEPHKIEPSKSSLPSDYVSEKSSEEGELRPVIPKAPTSEYQDDLYNSGEVAKANISPTYEQPVDVTHSNEKNPEDSAYFSAQGFVQSHSDESETDSNVDAPQNFEQSDSYSNSHAESIHNQNSQVEISQKESSQKENFQTEVLREPLQSSPPAMLLEAPTQNGYFEPSSSLSEQEMIPPLGTETISASVNEYSKQPSAATSSSDITENFDVYALPEWITFEQANAVSVDFDIPFKINGTKVLHASQLDTWSQLIEQSGIGALTKQLVLHSNYIKKDDVVELVIAEQQKHLLNEATIRTIEEGLSETLQQKITLKITVGEVIDTPWAVQRAINTMRQEHAVKTIQEDGVVSELCQHFSGTVLKETIKPR